MKVRGRWLLGGTFAITLFGVASVRATSVNLISANRSVGVTDTAGSSNGSVTEADSQSGALFAPFHGDVSKSAQWLDPTPWLGITIANSHASQNSTFSPGQWTVASHLDFATGGSLPDNLDSFLNSDSASFYQTTFSVSAPVAFNLLYSFDGLAVFDPSNLDLTTTLSSNTSGLLVDLFPNSSIGSLTVSGFLTPGEIYTLTFAQHLDSQNPDPLGRDGQLDFGLLVNFKSVPDQGALVSLVLGLFSVAVLRYSLLARARS